MKASEKKPLLGKDSDGPMTDSFLATPGNEPLGTAPKLWDMRFWHLTFLGTICIATIGLRINTAKMATVYDPSTGRASDETQFPKPLFLATTYFLGKLLILPFINWQPSRWPLHVYGKITLMVVLGAIGGMLEYGAVMYLPVSVVAMVRVAGLVFFTGFASAYITQRSPMTWQIALALTVVVAGACITSVYHIRSTNFNDGAIMGIVLVLLSTGSDALEQVVCEVIVQEDSVDVDVWTFAGVSGLIGSGFMGLVLCVSQFLPGGDNGVLEDTVGTIAAMRDWVLLLLIALTVVLCLGEMLSAAAMAKYYGVTTKEALLSFRIVSSWAFAVVIYYSLNQYGFGEPVTVPDLVYKGLGGMLILGGVVFYVYVRREAEESIGKLEKSSDDQDGDGGGSYI